MIKLSHSLHSYENITLLLSRSFRRSDIDSYTVCRHIFLAVCINLNTTLLILDFVVIRAVRESFDNTLRFVVINKIRLKLLCLDC